MKYLVDIYEKKPELVNELLSDYNTNITLKIDGSAFQIAYNEETNEIEYHKRGGDANHLGPIIDDYSKLFSKHLDDAVDTFNKKTDLLKDYRFLAIEIFNKMYVLLTAVKNDGTVLDNPDDLKEIADKLNIEVAPVIFNGKLNKEEQEGVVSMLSLPDTTTSAQFIDSLKSVFGDIDLSKFLGGGIANIEGIVLTFTVNDKIAQYKIINPEFKINHTKTLEDEKLTKNKYAEHVGALAQIFVDNIKPEKLDDNRLSSIEKNFILLIGNPKVANKIMNAAAKLPTNTNEYFRLRTEKTSKEMQKLFKHFGNSMKTAYEQFLMMFYKEKKRGFIISPEFQEKINEICGKM